MSKTSIAGILALVVMGGNGREHSRSLRATINDGTSYNYEIFPHHAIRYDSIKINGNTRLYYSDSDANPECRAACDDREECVGFVDNYLKDPPYCVLKKSTSNMYEKPGKAVQLKAAEIASCPSGYTTVPDGVSYSGPTSANNGGCTSACRFGNGWSGSECPSGKCYKTNQYQGGGLNDFTYTRAYCYTPAFFN